VYEAAAIEDLQWLTRRQQVIVDDAVQRHLRDNPTTASTRRVPMRPNDFLATWELRVGDLRAYYDVEEEPDPRVRILRVGIKERNRVRVRGRYVEMNR